MSEPSVEQISHMRSSFESFIHNASLATLVLAPTLILLPPRKLDFYTFSLSTAFVLSGTQLYSERAARLRREGAGNWIGLPAKAQQIKDREEVRRRNLLEEGYVVHTEQERSKGKGSVLEEKAREMWMGGETEGWKERRLAEERKKLAEGEGYGGMIMDQIWEVWNWGEKKAEGVMQKDEEVAKRRQREAEFPKIGKE